jgi:hypothetical protein
MVSLVGNNGFLTAEGQRVKKNIDAVMEPLVKRLLIGGRSGHEILGIINGSASLYTGLVTLQRACRIAERKAR